MEALAARTAVALDNARRYERERRTALAIRNSLPSGAAEEFGGCRAAHGCLPAGHGNSSAATGPTCSKRPGDRVSLIVGDAMGHGPESAVAMIQLRTAVRTLAALDIPRPTSSGRLDALAGDSPASPSPPASTPSGTPVRRTCTLVGAGPLPPAARPAGPDRAVALTGAGLPLGLGAGSYEETVLSVPDSALLVLYSDGLVESRDADIDHEITRLGAHRGRGRRRTRGRRRAGRAAVPVPDGSCTPRPARPEPTTAPCCSPN